MHRVALLFINFLFLAYILNAQALSVDVRINTPALKTADPQTLKTLERAIREFYNNTSWTSDQFDVAERIEANIQINIKDDPTSNSFVADIFISSGRPVFNSNYTSPILNHIDKDVAFSYEELTPIRDNATAFTDNLSSILTFYAYIILGFDYDSFSPYGGEEYFRTANNIISNIPPNISSGDRSWTSQGGDRNRYWLVENIFNPRVKRYRQAMYDYHRAGLDRMYEDVATSKAVILSSLKELGQVNEEYPNSMIVQMFSNSKRNEVLEIFKNSVKIEQRQVFRIMSALDPGQSELLKELN